MKAVLLSLVVLIPSSIIAEDALLTGTKSNHPSSAQNTGMNGWQKSVNFLDYGQQGLVGHNWWNLDVITDFGETGVTITGVKCDYTQNPLKLQFSDDGVNWQFYASITDATNIYQINPSILTRYGRMQWDSTVGSDGIHAQFVGAVGRIDKCADADTRCDDQNACTTDSCDVSTGDCIHEERVCDDSDACTTNSCDTTNGQCIFTKIDCDNGIYCDGEEFCSDENGVAQCNDGVIETCDPNFICDNDEMKCVRNCNLFAIDGYLNECSTEFEGNEADIAGLQNDVIQIQSDIDGHSQDIIALETSVGDVALDVLNINAKIGESNDVNPETIYDQLAAHSVGISDVEQSLSDAEAALNGEISGIKTEIVEIKGDITDLNEQITNDIIVRLQALENELSTLSDRVYGFEPNADGQSIGPAVIDFNLKYKDMLIISLLIINITLITGLLIWCCCASKKNKDYKRIKYDSESDQEMAQLNK